MGQKGQGADMYDISDTLRGKGKVSIASLDE